MAIELNPIADPTKIGGFNTNFKKIEEELNENVLRRDGVSPGEANQMEVDLDMNGYAILNVSTDTDDKGSLLNLGAADLRYVGKAGSTMSGALSMGGNSVTNLPAPTQANEATRKSYVDSGDSQQVSKTGDSMSGNLDMSGNDITGTRTTVTDNLILGGTPVNAGPLQPNTVIYVDTIADLQALSTSGLADGQAVVVTTSGKKGIFSWAPGLQTTDVSKDPLGGIWVTPEDDISGASGAWQKILNRDEVYLSEFTDTLNLLNVSNFIKTATFFGKTAVLNTATTITFNNTLVMGDEYRGARVIGRNPDGGGVKIIREGTADTWRSCFHVDTDHTYFDNLWLEPKEGFSERAGITYGSNAGEGNALGHIRGAFWGLGLVFPKLTPRRFTLHAQLLEAFYGGRVYSSDTIETPPGNIKLDTLRGYEGGDVDISGGHVEIGSVVWNRVNTRPMKKGNQQPGSVIKVGYMHKENSLGEIRLAFSTSESTLGLDFSLESTITGNTSGATALVHSRGRRYIEVYQVAGTFQVGETVSDGAGNFFEVIGVDNITPHPVLGNDGTNFELIEIGTLSAVDTRGGLIEIINEGVTKIDKIYGRNIKDVRTCIRFSPDEALSPGSKYGKSMSIGQIDTEGMELSPYSTYHPILLTGGNDAIFHCPSASFRNTLNVEGGPSRFFNCGVFCQISNWYINVVGGNFSRVLAFHSAQGSSAIGLRVDAPSNRWANVYSDASNISIAHVRYSQSASLQDDSGSAVLTDVVGI